MSRPTPLLASAAVALLLLLGLGGSGWSDAHPLLLSQGFHVPTIVVVLISALVGVALMSSSLMYATDVPGRRRIAYAALLPVLAIAGALLLAASVPTLSPPRAVAAMLLGTLAMVAGVRCVELIAEGEPVGFESHWGGLGGGVGGWRLLPTAALAILALSLAGGTLAVLVAEPSKAPEHDAPKTSGKASGLDGTLVPPGTLPRTDTALASAGSRHRRAVTGAAPSVTA